MKLGWVGVMFGASLLCLLGRPGEAAAASGGAVLLAETSLLLGVGERTSDLGLPLLEGKKAVGYQYSYFNLLFPSSPGEARSSPRRATARPS
jgi:hypothetical protein